MRIPRGPAWLHVGCHTSTASFVNAKPLRLFSSHERFFVCRYTRDTAAYSTFLMAVSFFSGKLGGISILRNNENGSAHSRRSPLNVSCLPLCTNVTRTLF